MKTLIKITALALLAALAVFSCAPEANLTGVDWNEVNNQYDSGKNSNYKSAMDLLLGDLVVVSNGLKVGASEANELKIQFPEKSDFLKTGNDVEKRMREFLSFHQFTKATEPVAGKADTLGEALAYTFVSQNVNTITIRLDKKFVAADSSVILKIDGTKYTFANGKKIDNVGRGRSGQAGYDDVYKTITVTDATGPDTFVSPGNRDWSLTLSPISVPPSSETTKTLSNVPIADVTLAGADAAIAAVVAGQLQSGLKVQKYVNGSWTTVDAAIAYTYADGFRVSSLSLEDLVAFRVMWEGGAPVLTEAEYFGVKQYIAIIGDNTGYTPSSNPARYQTSKVYGTPGGWYNNYDGKRFNASAPFADLYSFDSNGRNVVVDVVFNDLPAGVWIKDFTSDKQKFKDNFKLAYYGNPENPSYAGYGSLDASHFTLRPDVVYVDIKDIEFRSYDDAAGFNGVRITVDPNFQFFETDFYFYISPEIRYTDDKTTFGDPTNFMNGFFKAYAFGESTGGWEPPPTFLLSADTWESASFSSAGDERWYSFNVDGGPYYIWWDDTYGITGKNATVSVTAYNSDGEEQFSDEYAGFQSPRMISGVNGTVYLKVTATTAGTYAIVYSTSYYSRPWTVPLSITSLAADTWAEDTTTTTGEQWFSFIANDDTQYIHYAYVSLAGAYVQLYDSYGNTASDVLTFSSSDSTPQSVTSGTTYYIRVWPYSGFSGTYWIAFSELDDSTGFTGP
jgi:hypothetical protein